MFFKSCNILKLGHVYLQPLYTHTNSTVMLPSLGLVLICYTYIHVYNSIPTPRPILATSIIPTFMTSDTSYAPLFLPLYSISNPLNLSYPRTLRLKLPFLFTPLFFVIYLFKTCFYFYGNQIMRCSAQDLYVQHVTKNM